MLALMSLRLKALFVGVLAFGLMTIGGLPTASAQEKLLSIGVLLPLTGTDADTGANMKNAVELAFSEAGNRVGGYKLDVHWIDEGADPATATSNYERAIVSDKIQLGFLGYRSDAAVALVPLAARNKVPHLFGVGATELINEKFKSDPSRFGYWTTKIYPIPGNVSGAYADAITAGARTGQFKLKSHTVAIIGEDTDWGRSVVNSMVSSFKRNQWQVKSVDYFPKDLTDFSAVIAKIKTLDVSAVATTASIPQAAVALVKQYRASGLEPVLIVDGLGYVSNWYESTGNASDGVLDQHFVFASPAGKAFVEKFTAKAGFGPSPLTAGLPYDAAKFLLKVLERTEELHHEINSKTIYQTVQDELWTGKLSYSGIMNPKYVYSDATIPDPVLGGDSYVVPVVQYEHGENHVVWPSAMSGQSSGGN